MSSISHQDSSRPLRNIRSNLSTSHNFFSVFLMFSISFIHSFCVCVSLRLFVVFVSLFSTFSYLTFCLPSDLPFFANLDVYVAEDSRRKSVGWSPDQYLTTRSRYCETLSYSVLITLTGGLHGEGGQRAGHVIDVPGLLRLSAAGQVIDGDL